MQNNITEVLFSTISDSLSTVVVFFPRFVSGLIILLVGIIIAAFLKQVVKEVFRILKIESLLAKYGVPESKGSQNWSNILSEIVRWFVIILFLVPTVDIWGLGKFVEILNGLLLYLPNVFIAVMLLLVGFVVARLVYDLILASVHGLSKDAAKTVAMVGKWSVLIFVGLVALNQLGIASDLIRILFAGFIAMVALAGGLAFGLGGKDAAREVISKFKNKR